MVQQQLELQPEVDLKLSSSEDERPVIKSKVVVPAQKGHYGCPAPGSKDCKSIQTSQMFSQHWQKIYLKYVLMYVCTVRDCERVFR